jgi:endonuclease/exonuclease/phosphatase family metal-dependent hydrolase
MIEWSGDADLAARVHEEVHHVGVDIVLLQEGNLDEARDHEVVHGLREEREADPIG